MLETLNVVTLVAAAPGGSGGMMNMMLPMVLIFGIMYFMMIRPQQRKEKERRALINNLKSGTRVLFGGGIVGTITNVKDSTFMVKIAENVKIEVARGAVSRVLEKGDKITIEEEK
jgi:preprotein translocase subunit YajC